MQQPIGTSYRPPSSYGKNKAIISLVLGILSILFAWFGWGAILGIIFGVVGILLSINAKKDGLSPEDSGLATAGLVCSIVGLVLSGILFLSCVACTACAAVLNNTYTYS